ncbi:MAG: hypothetical protein IJ443_02800 [Firmicutes bacterium]|nr:hypothetical protein [Bacillota bacterium]
MNEQTINEQELTRFPTRFQSQVTYDLPTYREFTRGAMTMLRSHAVIQIIAIVYLAAYVLAMGYMGNNMGYFGAAAVLLLVFGVVKLVNRGGGLQYKRMVSNNGGTPVRNQMTISDAGIHVVNLDNGNSLTYGLDKIRYIGETEHLLILMLDLRQGLMIDKASLTVTSSDGEVSASDSCPVTASPDDLTKYLLSACPNLKKRKVCRGRGDRIRRGIIAALLVLGFVLAVAQGIFGVDGFSGHDDPYEETFGFSEMKMNDMTFSEIASELEALGFHPIDRVLASGLEESWEISDEEYISYVDKVTVLLSAIGSGTYDDKTWAWEPSSPDVYAFDMEMLNLETMYTEFLQGVSALGGGDLDFTDITENLDDVDWENGTGSRSVFFKWRGSNVALEADMMNDWFDLDFADDLNQLIAARCDGKQLYFGFDGYQMVFVFYCDEAWAEEFQDVTGLKLWESLS